MRRLPTLQGLVAAAHTPFDEAGELALDVIPQQARLFREQGLIGVFVAGSTGEWFSLTPQERCRLFDAWMQEAGETLHVIAHVGGIPLEDACSLAAHAESAGVHAISCLVPPGSDVSSPEEVVDYLEPVADSAPATPCMYYDMQALTGIDLPLDLVLEHARTRVPTLAGAKYTNTDLATLTRARLVGDGDLQVLMGRDEMLLGAMATGVQGAVGSTYNYAAPVYQRIAAAIERGDLEAARVANVEVVRFVRELLKVGVLPGAKAIMRWMGVDVGHPRPPHAGLGADESRAFYDAIRTMPIFARELNP